MLLPKREKGRRYTTLSSSKTPPARFLNRWRWYHLSYGPLIWTSANSLLGFQFVISDVHFEGSDDFESFKKGDIFVFTWSSYDNCFLCFKHTPTTTKHTEYTSSSNWVGYHLTK